MARTLSSEFKSYSGIENYQILLPEAMRCAVYINIRIVTKRTHEKFVNKTPYEVIMGQKPNLPKLKIFRCPVKVLMPKNIKTGKLSSK